MRTIITEKDLTKFKEKEGRALTATKDEYWDRLIKYIPAEVVAVYLALDAIAKENANAPEWIHWAIFVFGILGTILYLNRREKVSKPVQLAISAIAFMVWVFALGGPFTLLPWYEPWWAKLVVTAYTFAIAFIIPEN
jgi:hypothetical protein